MPRGTVTLLSGCGEDGGSSFANAIDLHRAARLPGRSTHGNRLHARFCPIHSGHILDPGGLSKAAARPVRSGWRYRVNVALRTLAGTVGAYGVAALTAAALARTLPMARVEAVTIATLIAYLVAPAVTIWAFLARGPWRALAGVGIAALLLGGVGWIAGQPA